MKRPSVVIRRMRPSVTDPTPDTNCDVGVFKKALLKA
jgi:hypothetical protein